MRQAGSCPPASTHNQDRLNRRILGVTDNPERGKAQGRNDRRRADDEVIRSRRNGPPAGTKPRSRIESNIPGVVRRRRLPDENQSGRGRNDAINRHVGPDEQRCSQRVRCRGAS